MARSSEKFEAIKQSVIYLEQARRLCLLLLDEPGGDTTAKEYLSVIRDKLADCRRKLKLSPRNSHRSAQGLERRPRPKVEHIVKPTSPKEHHGITPFTFVDVHVESREQHMKFTDTAVGEESKL